MATSAKRYGLEVHDNLELELRLRRIEGVLERAALVGDFGDGSSDVQRTTTVPQVTGLRVKGQTPGAVTLAWNQVRISNLRRYELDVAENLAFSSNKQTFNLASTEFQFSTASITGGGGNTTVYARVRARSREGIAGEYSITLNTTTGQAQNPDIADNAVQSSNLDSSALIQLALRGYIDGFRLANNTTDPVNDIDLEAGVARDLADGASIALTSPITKAIDSVWVSGNGGGFPSNEISLTDDTWYRIFVIAKSDESANDAGFDTSALAANLIAEAITAEGATWENAESRQIGWAHYLAATGIKLFYSPTSDPEQIIYQETSTAQALSVATSSSLVTLDVPPNVIANFVLKWTIDDNASQGRKYMWVKPTAMTDAAASVTNFTHVGRREAETDLTYSWEVNTEVDSSSQVRVRFDEAVPGSAEIYVNGFRYNRGRNE